MTKREVIHAVLEFGREGGYIFAPAYDAEGNVALENVLAFIDLVQGQPGYRNSEEDTNGQAG